MNRRLSGHPEIRGNSRRSIVFGRSNPQPVSRQYSPRLRLPRSLRQAASFDRYPEIASSSPLLSSEISHRNPGSSARRRTPVPTDFGEENCSSFGRRDPPPRIVISFVRSSGPAADSFVSTAGDRYPAEYLVVCALCSGRIPIGAGESWVEDSAATPARSGQAPGARLRGRPQ